MHHPDRARCSAAYVLVLRQLGGELETAWSEELRARRGELDRQRETVEAAADRLTMELGASSRPNYTSLFDEEGSRIARRERFQPILTLGRPWRSPGSSRARGNRSKPREQYWRPELPLASAAAATASAARR